MNECRDIIAADLPTPEKVSKLELEERMRRDTF